MKPNSVLTFLAGAALGAGLAILFAPHSGAETRRRIKERAKRDYDSLKERAGVFKEKLADDAIKTQESR